MSEEANNNSTETTDSSRRDFLKKAGKLAVYTPPIMLAMSSPSFATWGKSGGHEYPSKPYKPHKKNIFKHFKKYFNKWD